MSICIFIVSHIPSSIVSPGYRFFKIINLALVDTRMIGTKKNTFHLELKNRFTSLEERDDIDDLNKNFTELIQQSAMSIAKHTKKQKKPKIASPARAPMKKRREMIETKTQRPHRICGDK